jgi:hypothetical protein
VLAHSGLDFVVLRGDGREQIGLQDLRDLREHFANIALCVLLFCPEGYDDRLLCLVLRSERQNPEEAGLFLQQWNNVKLYCLQELFLLFGFLEKISTMRANI